MHGTLLTLVIRPLADHPETISLLSAWFHQEWHGYDGRSRQEIEGQLRESLNRDSVPVTFVAQRGVEVIGTVSLDESDLPAHDHLSPWLASLYVASAHRNQGVGRALVNHVIGFAREREISPIYLWTPGSTRLYRECGWEIFGQDTYAGRSITIMRRLCSLALKTP